MEKRKPSYTVGRNANWYSHYGERYRGSSENYKTTKLPYDPAILLLGVYPGKTALGKDTYKPIFMAILFTIAKK